MEFHGFEHVELNIRQLADKFPAQVAGALYREGEQIMTKSKQDFVPVDLGALKSSGFVALPEVRGADTEVVMAYGGAAAPYALAVHEHPSGCSPPSWQGKGTASSTKRGAPTEGVVTFHPHGRGPKYLERPMLEALPGMAERIAAELAELIQ